MIPFAQLDKTLHEKGRLGIMTLLSSRNSWSFQDLKSELDLSDGNLITHLRTLENAGHVKSKKHPVRRETSYSVTPAGKKSFKSYLEILEQIIQATR